MKPISKKTLHRNLVFSVKHSRRGWKKGEKEALLSTLEQIKDNKKLLEKFESEIIRTSNIDEIVGNTLVAIVNKDWVDATKRVIEEEGFTKSEKAKLRKKLSSLARLKSDKGKKRLLFFSILMAEGRIDEVMDI